MIQTTIDPTRPTTECTFVRLWCPIHGLSSTVTQIGLAAVICFPCYEAAAHAELRDPWCAAQLCDHWYTNTTPKETTVCRPPTRIRLTDMIVGGHSVLELDNLREFLEQWLPEPTDEMIGVMDDLLEKLNRGDSVDGECVYLGIKVEVL